MTETEIRKAMNRLLSDYGCDSVEGVPPSQAQIFFLAEIAAQLAKLNVNLSVRNSLASGGGYPEV